MVKKKTINEEVSLYTSVVLLTIIWLAGMERERGGTGCRAVRERACHHSHMKHRQIENKSRGSILREALYIDIIYLSK